jgi:hypothetical protein
MAFFSIAKIGKIGIIKVSCLNFTYAPQRPAVWGVADKRQPSFRKMQNYLKFTKLQLALLTAMTYTACWG